MTVQEACAQAYENGKAVGDTEGYARGKAEAVVHTQLGQPYVDEYFGQFADCKECGAQNILPCHYCCNCGRKIGGVGDA